MILHETSHFSGEKKFFRVEPGAEFEVMAFKNPYRWRTAYVTGRVEGQDVWVGAQRFIDHFVYVGKHQEEEDAQA